jgi:periplasmic divalent cation tolerance protein
MTEKIVVLSTAGDAVEADRIARALVESRLAACVNIVPGLRSIYRWKEQVEEASEFLLVIKTDCALLAEVQTAIERLHSYELPEVLAAPIAGGSEAYLQWLGQNLKQPDDTQAA